MAIVPNLAGGSSHISSLGPLLHSFLRRKKNTEEVMTETEGKNCINFREKKELT
jgi:hypothetical protein